MQFCTSQSNSINDNSVNTNNTHNTNINGVENKSNYNDDNDNDDDNSRKERLMHNQIAQEDIVQLMVKISWLTILSQIVPQFWVCAEIAYNVAFIVTNKHDYYTLFILSHSLKNLCIVVSFLSMYLAFIFNQQEYYWCCTCCHNCLNSQCIHCIYRTKLREFQYRKQQNQA